MRIFITSAARRLIYILTAIFCTGAFPKTEYSFEPIKWVDSGWYSVRANGASPDGRYASVELLEMRFSADTKSRAFPIIQETFLIDCAKSKGIKRVRIGVNLETDPSLPARWGGYTEEGFDKPYKMEEVLFEGLDAYVKKKQKEADSVTEQHLGKKYPLALPAPSTLAAEFACRVANAPDSAELVAKELRRTGGLKGLKEITCEIDFNNGNPPRETNLIFDESFGIVQFQDVWKRDVTVSPVTVKFKDAKFSYSINRTSGRILIDSLEDSNVTFVGNCVAMSDQPRKF